MDVIIIQLKLFCGFFFPSLVFTLVMFLQLVICPLLALIFGNCVN